MQVAWGQIQLLFCVFISRLFVMKLKMTYMILHYNSWMSVPAQAGILAGICILWLGILLYTVQDQPPGLGRCCIINADWKL